MSFFLLVLYLACSNARASEVALTFDDSPGPNTSFFTSLNRTEKLTAEMKRLKLPPALIFANPCANGDPAAAIEQLKIHVAAGNYIGNHTCSHPRLDDIGTKAFSAEISEADAHLSDLFPPQKFFRFPYLNEGSDPANRDEIRAWLIQHGYRNGTVSADNEDPLFSFKLQQARRLGRKIDLAKVSRLFVRHMVSSLECDDALARNTLGRSPRHVMLLHEKDATVLFLGDLVKELRKRGWKIIDAIKAYEDPIYYMAPRNTYSGFGIISQLAYEKTGDKTICYDFEKLKQELNAALGL